MAPDGEPGGRRAHRAAGPGHHLARRGVARAPGSGHGSSMKLKRRQLRAWSAATGFAALAPARAETFPGKPLHLIVPFTPGGTTDTLARAIAGQLQMGFTGAPVVMPLAKQGRVRALAVSSAQRSEAFPELPTIAESGVPGFEADQWYGITGPAGIDPVIANTLNAEINKALASADVKARLEKEVGAAVIAPPEALGRHIAAEIHHWRPVVKAANIRLD